MNDICPHCGQRMMLRCGVLMSPRQADFFDMIERAMGRGGIEIEVLAELMNPGMSTQKARNLTKVHIHHINNKLEETDFVIIGDRTSGRYLLKTRAEQRV